MSVRPYRPTPLEIASGLIFGFAPAETLPSPQEAGSPVEALERAILPGLLRPPCLVTFSGRPDSSAILAVAVRLARREGLELPVPATTWFPTARNRSEREAQERVIVHLGLTEWARFEFDDELDLVGPVAMGTLRQHGLMAPVDLHFHLPLLVEGSWGSLIVGEGGDNALNVPAGPSLWLRHLLLSRREPPILPWLRSAAVEEVQARHAAELASEPLRWKDRFAWLRSLRAARVAMDGLAQVAAPLRVQVLHPVFDPLFSAALRALPRTASMRELFGDLLPADLLNARPERRSPEALWNRHSRELAVSWDGDEVDSELVHVDALRDEWAKPRPDRRSFLLLQSVALAREGRSVARQLADAVGSFA
jgi:hypothetical protein